MFVNPKRNTMAAWTKVGRAAFWCLQQREWFTYEEFSRAAYVQGQCDGKRSGRPCRSLQAFVELGMLEKDTRQRLHDTSKPVFYRSNYIVRNREELERKFGILLKRAA